MGIIPLYWIVLGLLLIGSEFLIPGFVIFFFGAGAIFTGALSWIIPGLESNFAVQALIWITSSSISLAALRRYFKPIFSGSLLSRNAEDRAPIGEHCTVIEPIDPDRPGRIRYHGTSWRAVSYDETLEPGETVEIMRKEGMTFVVTRSIMEEMEKLDSSAESWEGSFGSETPGRDDAEPQSGTSGTA